MHVDDPSQFYTGVVAQLYRHLRGATFDPAPYERFVRRCGEPALELGCGDGDPLLDLVAAGLEVDGLDSSLDMLDRCRTHAAARGLSVRLHHQSIESMSLDRRYRSMYLAGATFDLLPDDDMAARALERISLHLEPGGSVLIPLFVPEPTDPSVFGSSREHRADDGSVMRLTTVSESRDDTARTQATVLRYEVLRNGIVADASERSWLLHWHTREGFRQLADAAGFTVAKLFEDTSDAFTFLLTRPS